MKNRNLLVIAALVLGLPAAPALAQNVALPCTPINTLPATISAPGNYCLAANHTVNLSAGHAINIAAHDVNLDCQSYSIINNSTVDNGSSNGIYVANRHNITIRNCRVMGGFTNGINMTQVNTGPTYSFYNAIEDNFVAGPYLHGIIAYGSGIEVRRNKVYDVGGQANLYAVGIRVSGSTASNFRFHVVDGNLVAGTNSPASSAYGILSDNAIGTVFTNNHVSGIYANNAVVGYGIRVFAGQALTLRDNMVLGGGRTNEVGIQTPAAAGWCYNNQVRVNPTAYVGCDTSKGNF